MEMHPNPATLTFSWEEVLGRTEPTQKRTN